MAYKKIIPKIMSDGNIARAGMIVRWIGGAGELHETGRIWKTKAGRDKNTIWVKYPSGLTSSDERNIRKSTAEEKKEYRQIIKAKENG